MILEGIVTSVGASGLLNVAPMGPRVEPDFGRFVLKPFRTSTTYANLKAHGEGVLHVTDDVLLFARATIGKIDDAPTRPAERVRGFVLLDACRYYEFKITATDDRGDRVSFSAETVHRGVFREFFGFNRAMNAVLESAILASRIDFSEADGLGAELRKHRIVVEKTGGARESAAFALLAEHIQAVALRRGLGLGPLEP